MGEQLKVVAAYKSLSKDLTNFDNFSIKLKSRLLGFGYLII
jgi:hypothetical protein